MKYYTRELYNQMQVTGFVGLNQAEDWESLYEMVFREHKEIAKKTIIEEVYHGNIDEDDIEIAQKMPESIINDLVDYNKVFNAKWKAVSQECQRYQSSIINSFPPKVGKFLKHTLHDVNIYEICQVGQSVDFVVGGGIDFSEYSEKFIISFQDVKDFEVSGFETIDTCLYEEFDKSEIGVFEYRVLMVDGEIRIVAGGVEVKPIV